MDSVIVLWPPVHVAVLWPVVAAVPLMGPVLISLSWAAAVHRSCCLGGSPCVLLESRSSAPRLIIRHLDLLSSNTLHLQEHGHISLVWTFTPSSFLIFAFASTSIAAIRHVCQYLLGLFPGTALWLQEWQICAVLKNVAKDTRDEPKTIVSARIHCVAPDFSHLSIRPAKSWKSVSLVAMSSVVRFPIMRRYLAWFSTCPLCQ